MHWGGSRGFEPATFQSLDDPLYLYSDIFAMNQSTFIYTQDDWGVKQVKKKKQQRKEKTVLKS